MTRPTRRPSAAMAAAMSGAVDLSAIKERALSQATQGTAPSTPQSSTNSDTAIVEATEANFEDVVLRRSMQVPVVVALWSGRSEASLQHCDELAALAKADAGTWVLAPMEAESNLEIARALGVQAIPHTVAIAAGRPIGDFSGNISSAELRSWVDSVLAATQGKLKPPVPEDAEPASDPRFDAAEDAVAAGDYESAIAQFQAIVEAEPQNVDARAALRHVTFTARANSHDDNSVTLADAAVDDVDLALAAADLEVAADQAEHAFERLIAVVRRTSGDDRTRVRTRLLELFELFDVADPVVSRARRALAAALY